MKQKKKWLLNLAARGRHEAKILTQLLSSLEAQYTQWDQAWEWPGNWRGSGFPCFSSNWHNRPSVTTFLPFAGWLQAYMYLGEGERLLKSLTNEDSWSQVFENATFYRLKAQVRNPWRLKAGNPQKEQTSSVCILYSPLTRCHRCLPKTLESQTSWLNTVSL